MLLNFRSIFKKTWLILLLIILVSTFFRVSRINQTPPGFSWDEAALGYNAYSILKTGKDEYGNFLPLILKSFGDYKPGLYSYLDIPFIAFDLNEFTTRLPSIILGIFIPLLGFLITKEIIEKDKVKIGLIVAILLAISPWAIHFSRGAWESNVAFFELMLGTLFLLKGERGGKIYFLLGIFVFILSILTYQSAKIISLGLLLGIVYLKKDTFLNREFKKITIISFVVFLLVVFLSLSSSDVRSRLVYLNQLSYPRQNQEIESIKKSDEGVLKNFYLTIYHSDFFEQTKTILNRYLGYFSPKFLFNSGPPDGRQGVLDYGQLHLFELPFLILGVIFLIRGRDNLFLRNSKKIILLWILISPIPAALSRDPVNTVRSLNLVFGLEFISALGIYQFIQNLHQIKTYLKMLFIIIIVINLFFFLDRLFVHTKIDSTKDYLYGYKEVMQFINKNELSPVSSERGFEFLPEGNKYSKIVVTTSYKEPYIYYLFYSKYPPEIYQRQANLVINNASDVGEVPQIDNIYFEKVDWHKYRQIPNVLLIGTPNELNKDEIKNSNSARIIKTINYPKGLEVFNIVETY